MEAKQTTNMKATLEFNLPDDQHEFDLAVNGLNWKLFAIHMEEYLRAEYKYNDGAYTEEGYKVLVQIRDRFYEILREDNLNLD